MSAASDSPAGRTAAEGDYREVLRTPWWWYLIALIVAGILAVEFGVAGLDAVFWVPFGAMVPVAVAIVWWLGRSRVEVRDDQLLVTGPNSANLPLRYVSGAVALDARTLRLVVGREGDPAAFVSIRPWVGSGVQVWLDDEDDPTPYWVVSSRHPDRLVAVLRSR